MSQEHTFTVYIYDSEISRLKSLVNRKQHIETGGDLFGLWINDRELVIQLIAGPGQDCRRTPTSFHQDVKYLESVGTYLTKEEGLCNVGEWHSHHRLGLARPSFGDEQTVWRSMNDGLTRFALFIANITGSESHSNVNVGCFLFDKVSGKVLNGKFEYLNEKVSPLRKKETVKKILGIGAEQYETSGQGKKNAGKRKKGKVDNDNAKKAMSQRGDEATNTTKKTRKEDKKPENMEGVREKKSSKAKSGRKKNQREGRSQEGGKRGNSDETNESRNEVEGGNATTSETNKKSKENSKVLDTNASIKQLNENEDPRGMPCEDMKEKESDMKEHERLAKVDEAGCDNERETSSSEKTQGVNKDQNVEGAVDEKKEAQIKESKTEKASTKEDIGEKETTTESELEEAEWDNERETSSSEKTKDVERNENVEGAVDEKKEAQIEESKTQKASTKEDVGEKERIEVNKDGFETEGKEKKKQGYSPQHQGKRKSKKKPKSIKTRRK